MSETPAGRPPLTPLQRLRLAELRIFALEDIIVLLITRLALAQPEPPLLVAELREDLLKDLADAERGFDPDEAAAADAVAETHTIVVGIFTRIIHKLADALKNMRR